MFYSLNLNTSSFGVVTFTTSLTCTDDFIIIPWSREISKYNSSMPISHALTKFGHQITSLIFGKNHFIVTR